MIHAEVIIRINIPALTIPAFTPAFIAHMTPTDAAVNRAIQVSFITTNVSSVAPC
jgi:hypothetical protein